VAATVYLPLARGRALTRAVLWAVPALLTGAAVAAIYPNLQFRSTAVSSAIVDYAMAIASLPLVAGALFCTFRALQHFLAAAWPGPLGVYADRDSLRLSLGPFGARGFVARELDIRYPFEMDDDNSGGFEQFLPEDEQKARLLPSMNHRTVQRSVHRTILRFAAGDEAHVASRLGPLIEHWRSAEMGNRAQSALPPSP
jgi:hypothetical protein